MRMKVQLNGKNVTASNWFGIHHITEHDTIEWFRFINMEELCKAYPDLFKPEIWLSDNPPQITKPKKTKLVKRK